MREAYSGSSSESECSSDSPRPKTPDVGSEAHTVDVVWLGKHYRYNIPSFSCLFVELRHVKVRWWNSKTQRHCNYDGFMKEDPSISNVVPATAAVANASFVDVR